MVYVGKFTGWYMEREMADFFAVARRSQPDLLFLIVTQADPTPMLRELDRCNICPEDYRSVLTTRGHRTLSLRRRLWDLVYQAMLLEGFVLTNEDR